MLIRYRLSIRDWAAFSLYHYLRYPLLWLIFTVLLVFTLKDQTKVFATLEIVPKLVAVLVFTVIALLIYFAFMAVMVAITMITRHSGNTLTEHTLELTDERVLEQTAHTRTETRWAGIQRLGITRGYVFLYIGPQIAHVIPRRALPDEASWKSWTDECIRRFRESRQ